MNFKLVSKYKPTGDQPSAIAQLMHGLNHGAREQTLLGVTGSGKTFTMANLIAQKNVPTLVLAHNKTLAAQLYSEFRDFFPENEVHYFVSYFDYYQPEAYIASSDTYIEKDSAINEEIDRLRHAATEALLTRRDTIIVASVSCIYGIGSPDNYKAMAVRIVKGEKRDFSQFIRLLTEVQYHRNDISFERGTFRVRGDTIDVFPASGDRAYRLEFGFDAIENIKMIDPLTAEVLATPDEIGIFPNTHYATSKESLEPAIKRIRAEFDERLKHFEKEHKYLEVQRLSQRVKYDLEMLEETGFVKGIENYSRHLEGRVQGQPPSTLMDYFPKDFLMMVDESHMTLPQVRGMYNGDHARKETLVEYGFRLPSALDNRPLTFGEFDAHINQAVYVSATPGDYELTHSPEPAQQVIRPTGLLDPEVEVRPTDNQIDDLIEEIDKRTAKGERVLVTTLTKRMAEDLSAHLIELGLKTAYLHSDIDTLERGDILRDLRAGVYDVLIGINLLREGLDLPEVSLVAILDADKEGFLRSEQALIQTIGRAARNVEGKVIMYADNITGSMERAIDETNRRRDIQRKYNEEHGITPQSVAKEISEGLRAIIPEKDKSKKLDLKRIPREEYPAIIKELNSQMQLAAANLEFERAAEIRDQIDDIKSYITGA
ncbi:MAG: excinuclease ABC subunit UvrB [Candidatus Nomurabacteria bacterium]|jgi:excinuclease ABC subunit B|nr:excinuclease ABC subunit UvrB [Candidatus Nomurabacteria bacterium]